MRSWICGKQPMYCVILEVLELKAVRVKTVKTVKAVKSCESRKNVGAMEANDA